MILMNVSLVVLLLAFLVGRLLVSRNRHRPITFGTQACTAKSQEQFDFSWSYTKPEWTTHLANKVELDPCRAFSETYDEARHKFRQAATHAGAVLYSYPISVPQRHALGKEDNNNNDYTIDIAVLHGRENSRGLTVHTSGVHGVEGYAGSAIQIAFLQDIYPLWRSTATTTTTTTTSTPVELELPTIVLIHAVNPFGMARYRRTNEYNVDLNRNAMTDDEWKTIYKRLDEIPPDSPYANYDKLSYFFNPKGPPTRLHATIGLWTGAVIHLARHGFDALKAAMVTGQYHDKTGIFYGGNELQPSYQVLWDFFQTTLLTTEQQGDHDNIVELEAQQEQEQEQEQNQRPTSVNAGQRRCCTGPVTWIDVHTGLGASGQDSLLSDGDSEDYLIQQASRWFPGAQLPQTSENAKRAHKGYDHVKGSTKSLFRRLWETTTNADNNDPSQQASDFLGMTQEFGAAAPLLVAHAFITENRAFQHLPPAQALEWAQHTTKRAFYKQTPTWRRQILERGLTLLMQAVQRSASSSSSSSSLDDNNKQQQQQQQQKQS